MTESFWEATKLSEKYNDACHAQRVATASQLEPVERPRAPNASRQIHWRDDGEARVLRSWHLSKHFYMITAHSAADAHTQYRCAFAAAAEL